MDEGEEARSKLVKAHGDTAEFLELEEEGLHKVAFLVQPPIDRPGVGDIRRWRDTVIRTVVGDELAKLALGVSSVGEDGRPLEVNLADQFLGNGDVSGIASGQHDRYGVAQSVYSGVNLRASAASTDANALIDLGFVYANLPVLGGGFYGFCGF
jgi:hypothetical protein